MKRYLGSDVEGFIIRVLLYARGGEVFEGEASRDKDDEEL
jgi:hypothetical protein